MPFSFRVLLRPRFLGAAAFFFGAFAAARAMSVVAPSFDELVQSSTVVFRGAVTDVHCVTVDTPQGSAIRTLVTFHVERALKGTPDAEVTLSFLGGKVGRRTMAVLGMPAFTVGQREIVFVGNNGNAICPILAGGHGRYHVRRDARTGHDIVARDNGAPLTSADDVGQPLEPTTSASAAPALSPDDFETRIVSSARNQRPRQLP